MDSNSPESKRGPAKRKRNPMTVFLLTLLGGYLLLVMSGCAWQRKLLYGPSRYTLAEEQQFAAQKGFVPWSNPAGEVIGWKVPATGVSTGSVLVVHGNGGSALNRDYIAQPIHAAGALDVFVLEYPGYGARGGSPSKTSWLA